MNAFSVSRFRIGISQLLSTVYLCYCLLFSKGYLVADAVAYLSSLQCSYVVPSISTRQCSVDTTPLRVETLVPRSKCLVRCDICSVRQSLDHKYNTCKGCSFQERKFLTFIPSSQLIQRSPLVRKHASA